jgi:hypothetical protein
MTGKRADHGHVDIFVLLNRGPKENFNLKKNDWQTGSSQAGRFFSYCLIADRERMKFLKKTDNCQIKGGGRFFWTFFFSREPIYYSDMAQEIFVCPNI